MARRAYFLVSVGFGVEEGDGMGLSPYFLDISWIARSISSRLEGVGVDGVSLGVDGVGGSSLAVFFFFFLFLDFLAGATVSVFTGTGTSGTTVSSSSDS